MCESRGENKALIKDLAELRQLYRDAQEDIQLLHDALAKQKNCNCRLKAGANGMDPRQDLISQLEENQEKVEMRRTPSKFCANLLYLKNALYLSGTKVLIEDTIFMSPTGDGTTVFV